MKLTLVRHGETEGNVLHIVESRTPGQLTVRGIAQARVAADMLRSSTFDAIYSSTLKRCVDMVKIIAVHHPGEITYTDRLRERNLGMYEGKPWESLPWYGSEGKFLDYVIPQGESWRDTEMRIALFLNKIYTDYPDGSVLAVTHGGPIKVVRSLLDGMTLQQSVDAPVHNGEVFQYKMRAPLSRFMIDVQ